MSDNLSFLTIPVDISVPGSYVEIDHTKAVGGLPLQQRTVLLIGTASNDIAPQINHVYRASSQSAVDTIYGIGSNIALMYKHFRSVNQFAVVDLIGKPSSVLDEFGMPAPDNGLAAIAAFAAIDPYTIVTEDAAMAHDIATELDARWGGVESRPGHVFACITDTYSNLTSDPSIAVVMPNSPHVTIIASNGSNTPPCCIAASLAGACELSGSNDPARPFTGLKLPLVEAPAAANRFAWVERNNLLKAGFSTIKFDQGGNCFIEQVITTYMTNSFDEPDPSLLKLNTKWTADYIRFAFRVAILQTFPRCKLADDEVLVNIQAGQPIATPKLIRNCLIAKAVEMEKVGLIENVDRFAQDLVVVRSVTNRNQVNAILPADVVNQFDIFAAALQFIL